METYMAGSGRTLTIREVAETYARVTGRAVPVRWGGRPYREREVMEPWSRGRELPGWRAAVDLEEGIRRVEAAERGGA
jgi:nucleoside-diphosphate-sugar epimerase